MKPKVNPPAEEPSSQPTDLTIGEMAEFTPSQRSAAQYEVRIKHLREEVSTYRNKAEELQNKLTGELMQRAKYSDLKRGKVEMMIQLITVTLLTGIGGVLMGCFPRSPNDIPIPFSVGATFIGIGVLLGVFVTPVTLLLCYVWPRLSEIHTEHK